MHLFIYKYYLVHLGEEVKIHKPRTNSRKTGTENKCK
jgi:hypothetical protein